MRQKNKGIPGVSRAFTRAELLLSSERRLYVAIHPEGAAVSVEEFEKHAAALLATLTPREEQVLRMLYGIGEQIFSKEEIGQRFAVTRERIRQIARKAVNKLRNR